MHFDRFDGTKENVFCTFTKMLYFCNLFISATDMRRTRRNLFIITLLALLIATGCRGSQDGGNNGEGVHFERFEQVLFDTPADQLPQRLADFRSAFPSPLLNIYPEQADFMAQLRGFIADSVIENIYRITQRRYKDLTWLQKELEPALEKATKADADISISHFATFVSGFFDYSQRILVDPESQSVLVSIDQYAVGDMERYSFFGLPLYIVELSDSIYMASDIMAEIARQYIAAPDEKDVTMLDRMIMEGKVLYFLDQVMPRKKDCLKIRYTDEQMEWCQKNERMIWAYFIEHKLLYEKDFSRYHNFVDEAPKTNAFKDSAPRTTDYIGWQIVRHYMDNSKCTLKELFENSNSQAILQASKYKP